MLIRYREYKRWFRKPLLVLQVGFQIKRSEMSPPDPDMANHPYWNEEELLTIWKDAEIRDVTEVTVSNNFLKIDEDNSNEKL